MYTGNRVRCRHPYELTQSGLLVSSILDDNNEINTVRQSRQGWQYERSIDSRTLSKILSA